MEHTMKIVEREKYLGIHVKCFLSFFPTFGLMWISEPFTEVRQLQFTVNNQFPLSNMNT